MKMGTIAAELGGVGNAGDVGLGVAASLGGFTGVGPWTPQHVLQDGLVAALPSGIGSVCHGIQDNNLGALIHKIGSPYQDYSFLSRKDAL